MQRLTLTVAIVAVALVLAACSSASGAPAASAPSGDADVTIVAIDMAFDRAEHSVPAGTPFTIEFANRDGAPHNVAIYADSSATTALFRGEIFGGDATKAYDAPALDAGSYFFRCDVHPDMAGTIVAE